MKCGVIDIRAKTLGHIGKCLAWLAEMLLLVKNEMLCASNNTSILNTLDGL